MDNDNKNKQDNGNNDKNHKNRIGIIICLILTLAAFMMYSVINNMIQKEKHKEVSYNEFLDMLENDEIESVVITSGQIEITPVKQPNPYFEITYYTGYIASDQELVQMLKAAGVTFKHEIQNTGTSIMDFVLFTIFPLVLLWGGFFFIFRMISKSSGGMMGVGKSNAKMYVQKETGVTFKDVAGQEEAMESLTEIVDFLHNPQKYTDIGAKLPKGALLVGPPGTGKTLLAKAVAGEAGVPFFSLSGSGFVEMFVGVGASRVRDLFKQAQQMAPCIIFIDEIDAIGKSRDGSYGGGNDEREQTLNQLLSEMDGFDSSKGLVVLGATNRPEVLDKALLRPGRFDRRIIVERPDLKGRIDILKVHAKDVLMDDSVDFEEIALATSGAAGSDLANMINEAAIMAVKAGRKVVSQTDLFEAVEVVVAGKEKKERILSKKEKRIVAYHEVGHALVTALEKNAEPVQKITIIPRTMGSLGYVMQVPEEEKYLMSKDEILARIETLFGGRAAEELIFESITTGASNDIEKATSLARSMVTRYGMTEKFGLIGLETIENQYLDGRSVTNCGSATESEIDNEVMKILRECYDKAAELLGENKDVLDKIAEFLIEKETITGKEFMRIFREVKGLPEPEEDNDKKEDGNEAGNKDAGEKEIDSAKESDSADKTDSAIESENSYDVLVLDIDGTLTTSTKEISEKTREAVIAAQEKGKTVVIASGRSFAGIRRTAEKIHLDKFGGYILAYNGGASMNCKTGERIAERTLDRNMMEPVYDEAIEQQIGILAYNDKKLELVAGNGVDEYIENDAKVCEISIRDEDDFLQSLNFPVNKLLLCGDPEQMAEVEKIMQGKYGNLLSIYRSDPFYVEVVPKGVDKAAGLDALLRYLGKDKSRTICIGDSYNDLTMIEYAGLGIAMGNAIEEIKEAASYVTDSNDEDGVASAIRKFMPEVFE